ncbi:MAG TPA: ATP-binding protein [Caulobacteraceae bacterium]
MRGRLFWKILLGFWLTYAAVTLTVWIGALAYSGGPSPAERAQWPGAFQLASAMVALRSEGPDAVKRLTARWTAALRRQLVLTRLDAPPPAARPGAIVIVSKGRDGVVYRLTYTPASTIPAMRARLAMVGPLPFTILALWILAGLLFSALLAWYLTQPINRLRGGFDRLAHGDLTVRLKPAIGRRRDEIADLAGDFDTMAGRLQQLVAARDRLLHDVSHELRSPLARLNMAIGLARQAPNPTPERVEETLTRIEYETARLDVLVGELLTLSRVESGGSRLDGYFEVEGLVRTVVADARYEAETSGVEVRTNVDAVAVDQPGPTVKGDAELMRRAVENIVRNALRFSGRGQRVEVDVDADEALQSFVLRVADEGPGVPPEGLESMFEPFVRVHGAASGKGYGLGLAIARRTVLAHGGEIEARNRPEGGLEVTVMLPFGPSS